MISIIVVILLITIFMIVIITHQKLKIAKQISKLKEEDERIQLLKDSIDNEDDNDFTNGHLYQ